MCLLELLRYIHLNPVRARMVQHPSEYPWSSHHAYLGESEQSWVTTDFALRMFHSEHTQAIDAYRQFIDRETGRPGNSPLSECNPADRRILGSDDFAGRLLGAAWKPKSRKQLEAVIHEACDQFSVTLEALQSTSAQRHLTKVRAWITHQSNTLKIASAWGAE